MFGWVVVKIKCKIRSIFGGNSSVIKREPLKIPEDIE